jgi:hypothetical protein
MVYNSAICIASLGKFSCYFLSSTCQVEVGVAVVGGALGVAGRNYLGLYFYAGETDCLSQYIKNFVVGRISASFAS